MAKGLRPNARPSRRSTGWSGFPVAQARAKLAERPARSAGSADGGTPAMAGFAGGADGPGVSSHSCRRCAHQTSASRIYPNSPYPANYCDVFRRPTAGTLRMAWVQDGPGRRRTRCWMLHGEPSWSYLYRKMIPVAGRGWGTAFHLPGPGRLRSLGTKPTRIEDHSYARSRRVGCASWCSTSSTCRRVTLVGQDWGGLIGLRLGRRTSRPVQQAGRRQHRPAPPATFRLPKIWWQFRQVIQTCAVDRRRPGFVQGWLPSADERRGFRSAYDAPFPDDKLLRRAGRRHAGGWCRHHPRIRRRRPTDPPGPTAVARVRRRLLVAFSDRATR